VLCGGHVLIGHEPAVSWPRELEEHLVEQHTRDSLTWIHVDDPASDALASARDEFGVPDFAIEVALRAHHRSRMESYGGFVLLALKPATYVEDTETIEISQLVVIAGQDVIITIGEDHRGRLSELVRQHEEGTRRTMAGSAAVVHAITAAVVDDYATVLEELDAAVDNLEAQVFSENRESHAERIYRLKREVQAFRRAVGPLPVELDELRTTTDLPEGYRAMTDQFGDVHARAERTAEHVSHLDELLNGVLNAHLAQTAIRQNDDMRRISAWVAVVAAPTAMASLYGMNFRNMPELEWRYGYFTVLAVMASVCLLLYRLFKRSGWL
jgi:magnesium transporter